MGRKARRLPACAGAPMVLLPPLSIRTGVIK